jgi:hypothetical protein
MPLTPFVGLSVLIHMCVITGNKILYKLRIKTSAQITDRTSKVTGFLAFFIIFGVSSFVIINAFFLIKASVYDRHSVFVVAEKYFKNKIFDNESVSGESDIEKYTPVIMNNNLISKTCTKEFPLKNEFNYYLSKECT